MSRRSNFLEGIFRNNQDRNSVIAPLIRKRMRGMQFEQMEPRVLLSAAMEFIADAAHSDLTLRIDNAFAEILDSSTGTVLLSRALEDTSSVNIAGSEGDDALHVDSTAAALGISFDGGAGEDKLFGPASNSTWNITGDGAGSVGNVTFASIENLIGAADNEDTFIFAEDGGLQGLLHGGDRGFDSMVINPRTVTTTVYSATGPDSGSVILDGVPIRFAGLEPITNNADVANLVVTTSASADQIRVKSGGGALLTIQADNGTFESYTFAAPTTSLTLKAGAGDDVITLQDFDFGALTFNIDGEGDTDTLVVSAAKDIELDDSSIALRTGGVGPTIGLTSIDKAYVNGLTVDTTGFTGPTVASTVPQWVEQGPGPMHEGQVRGIEDKPVSGAIQAVLAHPTNANIIYIGSVNGGVWKTTDGGTSWNPMSDQMPSLSISAMAFDTADPFFTTIYAGTGKRSSYLDFGKAVGLMKSTDGGTTWTTLGKTEFDDETIYSIVANGSTITVGTEEGLYQSTNDGETFSLIRAHIVNTFAIGAAGTGYTVGDIVTVAGSINAAQFRVSTVGALGAVTGLELLKRGNFETPLPTSPWATVGAGTGLTITGTLVNSNIAAGQVSELVVDPSNPLRMYAGVIGQGAGHGVLRSNDGGSTWVDMGQNLPAGVSLTLNVSRLRLSFSTAPSGIVGTSYVFVGIAGLPVTTAAGAAPNIVGATTITLADTAGIEVGDPLSLRVGATGPADDVINVTAVNRTTGVVTLASGLTKVYPLGTSLIWQDQQRAHTILRLADDGSATGSTVSWVKMDTPGDSFGGINPGGQASNHFSLLADATDPDVVFVGGDVPPQNAAGSPAGTANPIDWTGRLFRGDLFFASGSQWTAITDDNANGTSPHADSRNMVWDASGRIIEVDDGGIKRLLDPDDSGGDREWFSLDGNLRLTEFTSVDYDPNNGIIIGGAQDNGYSVQDEEDSHIWTQLIAGDGAFVNVRVDGSDSEQYGSSQNLGFFSYTEFPDDERNLLDLEINSTGFADDDELAMFDKTIQFTTPWIFNNNDEDLFLLGTQFIYEEDPDLWGIFTHLGDDLSLRNGAPIKVDGQYRPDPNARVGEVEAIAYGGKTRDGSSLDDVDDVAYVGVRDMTPDANGVFKRSGSGSIYVRLPGDDEFIPITSWDTSAPAGDVVLDIVMDPEDWRRVYVLDDHGHVWLGVQAAPDSYGYTWTEITGTLPDLTTTNGRRMPVDTIAIYYNEGPLSADGDETRVLMVGGSGGVYRTKDPVDNTAVWSEFGVMPNTRVTDIRYNATADVLLAGTLGRGAFTIANASQWLMKDSTLVLRGASGASADTFTLVMDQSQRHLLDIFINAPGQALAQVPLAGVDLIQIFGGAGDDVFEIDGSQGLIVLPKGISINGGSNTGAGDTLQIDWVDVVSSSSGAGEITATAPDSFGEVRTATLTYTLIENLPPAITPTVDPVDATGGGLADATSSFQSLLRQSLGGQDVGLLNSGAISNGLSGTFFDHADPPGLKQLNVSAVQIQPGGALQLQIGQSVLDRIFASEDGSFSLSDIVNITSPLDLVSRLDALDNMAGNVSVDTSTVPGETLFTVQIVRNLSGIFDLDLDGAALLNAVGISADAINIDGRVDLDFQAALNIKFGTDASGFFIRANASAPELSISKITVGTDGLTASGRLGFIGVDVKSATINFDQDVALNFKLHEQGTIDQKIRVSELQGAPAAAMTFSISEDASANDLVVVAQLAVSAVLPGLGEVALPIGDTTATFTWTDLSDPFNLVLTGPGGVDISRFIKLNPTDLVAQMHELKASLADMLADVELDIPFVSVSLDGLLNVFDFVDDNLLSRISSHLPGGGAVQPKVHTVQGMISAITSSLMESARAEAAGTISALFPFDLGDLPSFVSYNSLSGELTLTLDFKRGFSFSDDLDLDFGIAGDLADFSTSATAGITGDLTIQLKLGIDVKDAFDGASPLDWLFLRDVALNFAVNASALDIDALARFGFLKIEVFDGQGTANLSANLSLVDPDQTSPDGRIDLRELKDAVLSGDLGDLVDFNLGGSAHLELPVRAPILGITGTTADSTNTLIIDIDMAHPEDAAIILPSALLNLGNFRNIDAATVVGLLGQLTFWLDEFRKSDTFADFDIPLIGPTLDEALQFADNIRDQFLVDDNDSGADSDKTLLSDLNAALADAGLGRKFFAANVGGKITFFSLDASITSFTVAGATALGFGASQIGTIPVGKLFAKAEATSNFTDLEGNLGGDLSFTITFGGTVHTVEVDQDDTTQNTAIGDDLWKLVNGQNDPTFATMQEMSLRLIDAFGGGSGVTYEAATQSLNFTLDLSKVFFQDSFPLNFSMDDLLPDTDFFEFSTSGELALKVAGGLNLEVGIFLGPAEPTDKLLTTTTLLELDEPLVIDSNQRYTAQPVVGKLTGDATFKVFVNGAVTGVDVTVLKTAAATNTTVADMVTDLNAALTTAGLSSQVVAQAVPATGDQPAPSRIQLVGLAGVTSLKVTASATNPAATEIGLPTDETATGASPKIVAARTLAALKGRLTADASFRVSLTNGGTTDFDVTLTPAETSDNNYPFSIINDITAELDTDRIEVSFSNGALTFTTTDGSSIAVSNVSGTATNELGIVAGSGNKDDLLISVRGGATHHVFLDGALTIGDVISRIQSQTLGDVTVTINAAGSGLNLKDETFDNVPAGSGKFKVQIANNSTAGLLLGIIRPDAGEGETADGIIEGAGIASLQPLDRFFVKATPASGPGATDPLAGLTVEVGIPVPLTANAKFGFVELGLTGDGGLSAPTPPYTIGDALRAALTVRLIEPAGSTDGRISLAEILNSIDDIGSLFNLSLTGQGKLNLELTPATITTLSGLGVHVDASPRIELGVDMTDNVFAGNLPEFTFNAVNFDELLDFGNVEFNFQSVLAALVQLVEFLDDFEALSFLNDPIPVIDVSVKDLVSIVSKFADAVTAAQNDPAGSLQALENKLLAAFGLPPGDPALNLMLVDGPGGSQVLKVDTLLTVGFSKSLPINLDLGLDPLELGGNADLLAEGSIRIDLDFGIDVADPTNFYIFDSTGIIATLNLAATNLDFKAAVGPLGVFITDGEAHINGTLEDTTPTLPANTVLTAGFSGAYSGTMGMSLIGDVDLGEDLAIEIGGEVDVDLPVYFPTESIKAGTVMLDGSLSFDSDTGLLDADLTPSAKDAADLPIDLDELFVIDPSKLSLLDQLLLGVDGIDFFLEGLQDLMDGKLGDFEMPFIGDKLAGATDVIGDFRSGFVEDFRKVMEDLANPGAAFAEAGYGPGGTPGVERDPISKMLFSLLGPAGLGVMDSINEITFTTNVNQAGVAPGDVFFDWDLSIGDELLNEGGGIGFDLGIPGLGLETEGDINLTIAWNLDFGFGINFDDGFYLDIADDSELQLDITVTVPGIGITGTLGFLQVTATEDPGDDVTHLGAAFAIDIINRNDPTDEKLAFSQLGSIGIDPKIAAEAVADLTMRLSLSSELVPSAPTNFPSVVADFTFDWGLGDLGVLATHGDETFVSFGNLNGGFLKNGLKFVGFEHVGLDLGSYLSDLIKPITDTIKDITDPIKPFLDFLTEPIPVISDLAGPTSLLDIAEMSGLVNPGIIIALEVIDQVVDIANQIPSGGSAIIYFDSFLPALTIFDASAPGGSAGIDLSNPSFDLEQLRDTLLGSLPEWADGAINAAMDLVEDSGIADSVKKMLPGGSASGGFSLPIIKDPSQIFGMLMGQPAVLVQYEMAALELEAEFSAFFSIFGPLGVSINAEFAAQFGPFVFGYDTLGISQFASSGFRNPLLLFDGFFVGDLDGDGADVPELQFDAGLWAAAELNLGIARGGVGGGLFAEIDFDLHDPNDDGRVRIKEIVTNILNQARWGDEPLLAPLAMFDITGKLTAELFAFLKIDFGFFEVDEKFLITEPITLLDFESDFERFPTLATELPNGVLQLNMGKFADQRIEGDLSDLPEEFHVEQDGVGHVLVWAPSLGVDHSEAQEYAVSSLIIALGGEGNDTIDLSLVTDNLKFELEGNAGDDTIKAGSGTGAAYILGGAGNDHLWGGGGNDTIFGEGGDDEIHGGAGLDWLFGDGSVKDSIQGNTITVTVKANDGSDDVFGDAGDDLIFGAGGEDTLEGGVDADVLIGDGGKVVVGGDRRVVTLRSTLPAPQEPDPGRLELAVSDTSQANKGARDTLRGDAGNDHLYGGVGDDILEGGADADVIYGELGPDVIQAGAGADVVFGDFGTFVMVEGALEPEVTAGGENDEIHGGAGNDKLLGGGGKDTIFGDADSDKLYGGTGQDMLDGGAGADFLFGNADSDQLFGGTEGDYIEGGGGNDFARGGAGDDLLVAGYGSDDLDGEGGNDSYQITARGGSITDTSITYDSGADGATDILTLVGTNEKDTILLRAMADFYFPEERKLIGDAASDGLTDKIFASGEPDKLRAILQALEDSYGPHDIPAGLISTIIDLYVAEVKSGVLAAITSTYVAGAGIPALADLLLLVDDPDDPDNPTDHVGILDTDSRSKLDEIRAAITDAYGENTIPPTMFDKIANAWDEFTPPQGLKQDIENAIHTAYKTEDEILHNGFTDTGFVALINNGGANVERFNYRNLEGLVINTLGGDDYVVSDDVIAATTINLGVGEDRVQIGQVFRSERVKDPGAELITGITAEDVFTTLEITRGWLSNGISRAMTVNGGDNNDQFTVFHNIAVLNLNGGDGDDVFTVRAFALKGSTDSERARTDMKGDGGADTILYVVNAPVGIDGGDGFDTVRIVGTEFADDFVVTDAGIFGAGLSVSYVNIEKLVADGAEGDDRFFVQSTGLEVVTEIDGGLGSDSFFVGGNPSRAPVPVISNDFKGHSGIILHSVESGDTAWAGIPVEGLSANVGDNEEDFVLVREESGFSRVYEGAVSGGLGLVYDGYGIRLTRQPGPFQVVRINVVPAGMAPEDAAKNFKDLEFFAVSSDINAPLGASLGFNPLTGVALAPTLTFTTANWNQLQYVRFKASDDSASEGRRFVFINHTLQNSSDPDYQSAQMLSVKVEMLDNDRDGVLVVPSGRGNTVLEDGPVTPGFTDTFDVVLAKQPTSAVQVTMSVLNSQITLSGPTVVGGSILNFTMGNWNTPQTVTITAPNDAIVEGFHTDYISFLVSSADSNQLLPSGGGAEGTPPAFIQIDGDFDLLGVQSIPAAKPTSYVLLPHRPSGPVTVTVNGIQLPDGTIPFALGNPLSGPKRFEVSGNTLTFLAADGRPEFRTGIVMAKYNYTEPGYNGSFVKDSVVDIYDEDAPTVIIQVVDDGSLDVIEGAGDTDQYSIRLSRAPSAPVQVNIDAVETRSTYGRTAEFEEQVTVNGASATFLTFNAADWFTPKFVNVAAINDSIFDGNDTQVFAPDLQTVNKIRGPLIIEGAAGAGSLSLPRPLMLPHERSILAPDGLVQAFTAGSGGGAIEIMEVLLTDLNAVITRLRQEDSTIDTIQDLVGKTLELSSGPGTGVVLDPERPEDVFDRFWLINTVLNLGNGKVRLSLQNPTLVDPSLPGVTAPTTATKYAITSLSLNFFADEREQVDFLFVFDDDSVANDKGALTSADGVVRTFTPSAGPTETMVVETAALQAVAKLDELASLDLLEGRRLEITVGPGQGRAWTIFDVADNGTDTSTKLLTLTKIAGGSGTPTDRSEFRIAGGDTHGRITGFGMGANILFNGRPQPGGITYGDIEVVQMSLGTGNDEVRVDYATNSEDHTTKRSGDFYTLTMLDTGAGNDVVTVNLQNGEDGAFSLDLKGGNDTVIGGDSTAPLIVFGGDGNDTITGGSGADILFGDRGRVDYVKTSLVNHDNNPGTPDVPVDQIITRLGHSVPANPKNPPVTGATLFTLSDSTANFSTEYGGLVGLSVQAISPEGRVQFRTIVANTATTVTIDRQWDATPVFGAADPDDNYFYRISNYPEDQTDGVFRGPRVAWTIEDTFGGNDQIQGGGGADIVIGGFGGDPNLAGGVGADWVVGDAARFDFVPVAGLDGPTRLLTIASTNRLIGGVDTIFGDADADVLIGGTGSDNIDGGSERDLIFGDNVSLTNNPGSGDAIDPRFRGLTGSVIYGSDGLPQVAGAFPAEFNPVPGGRPAWGDLAITLDPSLVAAQFGDDYIAGGAADDEIFGQLGNDVIQGDGSIANMFTPVDLTSTVAGTHRLQVLNASGAITSLKSFNGGAAGVSVAADTITMNGHGLLGGEMVVYRNNGTNVGGLVHLGLYRVVVVDANTIRLLAVVDARRVVTDSLNVAADKLTGLLVMTASGEATSDGDDYIEGNGGNDVLLGGLGQDDIIGGNSSLFSLTTLALRPDGADLIFGGAGTDTARNDAGDASNGRDADMILGDNGNIYRLVTAAASYLNFNYDNAYAIQILPRAAELLDYTPGGPDYNAGAAATNSGAADEIHGESGDDFLYGMVGGDAMFGDGQNDVIVGGYGADWISGGTGDDGILGDDGRVFISRNSLIDPEPLYGIAVIPAGQLNALTSFSSGQTTAVTNVSGALKYTVDLTPFSVDPTNAAPSTLMPRALHANDMIFGGLGTDALHGGAGEDAISGAEAMGTSYVNNYLQNGDKVPGAPIQSDFAHPVNPGNVLGYNPTTTKFAFYDANDPLRKIMLNATTGVLAKTANNAVEWALNFVETEGPVDTFWIVGTSYTGVNSDGDDHVFGDLGHDWLVGGTGRDSLWGGWGDDLMNADDKLLIGNGFDAPDTNPSWEDFVYGGAGRDVLIGNTGGERMWDWTGEFNTFGVPYNPFGIPTVQRIFQPAMETFLLALSKSQGADQTLAAQYGSAVGRNGEPFGEIGMVLQQDAAWNDQIGSPRDPQSPLSNARRDVNPSAGVQPIFETADALASSLDAPALLTDAQLAAATVQAKAYWSQELGAGDSRLAILDSARIEVGNLPDLRLGATIGGWVLIDSDAAGYGWSLDSTATRSGQMDLLSVVKHEIGHLLGFDHDDEGLMSETLAVDQRKLERIATNSSTPSSLFDYAQVPAAGRSSLEGPRLIDWTLQINNTGLGWGPIGKRENFAGFPEFSIGGSSDHENGKTVAGPQKKRRFDPNEDVAITHDLSSWDIEV